MKPGSAYAFLAAGLSVVLFALWRTVLQAIGDVAAFGDTLFLIPTLSVIVVSFGHAVSRKVVALAAIVTCFVVVDALSSAVFQASVAGPLFPYVGSVRHALLAAVPLIGVGAFIGEKPDALWTRRQDASGAAVPKCPICGKRRAGLEAHIRDAHGAQALKRFRSAS